MSYIDKCRICTVKTDPFDCKQLFSREQRILLEKIEKITGLTIKDRKKLPQLICGVCENDLNVAFAFRLRCIKSEKYFIKQFLDISTVTNYTNNQQQPQPDELQMQKQIDIVEGQQEEEQEQQQIICDDLKQKQDPLNGEKDAKKEILEIEENILNICAKNKKKLIKEKVKKFTKSRKIEKCKIVKKRKEDLTEKQQQQTQENFICEQCGNHFSSRSAFMTHARRHNGDRPFDCEICSDKFFTTSELKRHMRKHTGERPYACKFCQRRFTDFSTRVKHERTHTNERPFKCNQCDKAFGTSFVLKNHMLTHTGERLFKCLPCNKSFLRKVHLVTHYRSITHKQNAVPEQIKVEPDV